MLAIALFSWWYTTAWKDVARRVERRTQRMLDFFSVGLLFRTLFDPFRQIAAGKVKGSVDAQLRAWADRTFSRFFGAAVRSLFILIGLVSAFFSLIIGFLQLVLWPCVPFLPVLAVIAMIMGWTL